MTETTTETTTLLERTVKGKDKTEALYNELKNKIPFVDKLFYNYGYFLIKFTDKYGMLIEYKPSSLDYITLNLYNYNKNETFPNISINYNYVKNFNNINEIILEIYIVKDFLSQLDNA